MRPRRDLRDSQLSGDPVTDLVLLYILSCYSHGAEAAEDEAPERPKRQSAFRGSGYRLGETEAEMTEVIQGGPMSAGPKKVS